MVCFARLWLPAASTHTHQTLPCPQGWPWRYRRSPRRSCPARRSLYLAGWAASRLALFACRLVLAHNRVLYPFREWLLRTVTEVPDRPDDFVDLVRVLAIERTPSAAEAVVVSLLLSAGVAAGPRPVGRPSSCWTASGTGSTVNRQSTTSDRGGAGEDRHRFPA